MTTPMLNSRFDRRTLLKGAAALGAFQVTSPFIIGARGETPIRMGMVDPLTGVYAAPAGNEVMGAKLAVAQINAKGGILGRQVELLVNREIQENLPVSHSVHGVEEAVHRLLNAPVPPHRHTHRRPL